MSSQRKIPLEPGVVKVVPGHCEGRVGLRWQEGEEGAVGTVGLRTFPSLLRGFHNGRDGKIRGVRRTCVNMQILHSMI